MVKVCAGPNTLHVKACLHAFLSGSFETKISETYSTDSTRPCLIQCIFLLRKNTFFTVTVTLFLEDLVTSVNYAIQPSG